MIYMAARSSNRLNNNSDIHSDQNYRKISQIIKNFVKVKVRPDLVLNEAEEKVKINFL